jgi:hypothetical protein
MGTEPVRERIHVLGAGRRTVEPGHAPVTIIVDLSLYAGERGEPDSFLPVW